VERLEDVDLVAEFYEIARARQARWPAADDGDAEVRL